MSSMAEWDERFARGDHASPEIDPFLADSAKYWRLLPAWNAGVARPAMGRKALDIACGAGRHAVYLAEAGFDVTAVDFSLQGLEAAQKLATARQIKIETRHVDLETPGLDLGGAAFDVVVVFFYLHRPMFATLARCIRPGGLLVYKTYSVDQLRYPGRPRHSMHMLEHNELLREFSSFRVLRYEEEWEGRGTAALIAQRP
jgi:SAM-dependent methyltransferase